MKYLFIIVQGFYLFTPLVAYSQITEGLMLDYDLNNNVTDGSGNNNDGIINNASFIEDRNGNQESAIYFDGTSSILLPNNPNLKPELPLTLSLFLRLDNVNGPRPIYHSDVIGYNYAGFFINVNDDGRIMAHIGSNLGNLGQSNRRSFLSDNSISVGNWHHIVVNIISYDDIKIFIDCQESGGQYSGSGSTNIVYSNLNGGIGEGGPSDNFPNGYYFEGAMDDLKLWNRSLTVEEIEFVCSERECDNMVHLSGQETGTVYIESSDWIQSSQIIVPNAIIYHDAADSIILKPNFHVQLGSYFHALIDGCL